MGKRSKSKNRSRVSSIANVSLRPSVGISNLLPLQLKLPLSLVEDNRIFHPEASSRPPLKAAGTLASFKVRKKPTTYQRSLKKNSLKWLSYVPDSIAFADHKQVLTCVRRKRRKEVLFAKRKAGKSGQRRPRFNSNSSIFCGR